MLIFNTAWSDFVAYSESLDLAVQQDGLKVTHHHDWRSRKCSTLFLDLTRHDRIFGPDNDFSLLSVVDANSNEELFRTPVPALTELAVLGNGELVVGISNVKLCNPYQLVVFSRDGERLLAQHVSSYEACFSESELEAYWRDFPEARDTLQGRTTIVGNTHYVDFSLLGVPNVIGQSAWDRLMRSACASHLSNNISESVSNWVFWFDEENPNVSAVRTESGWTITMNDPVGETITFEVMATD